MVDLPSAAQSRRHITDSAGGVLYIDDTVAGVKRRRMLLKRREAVVTFAGDATAGGIEIRIPVPEAASYTGVLAATVTGLTVLSAVGAFVASGNTVIRVGNATAGGGDSTTVNLGNAAVQTARQDLSGEGVVIGAADPYIYLDITDGTPVHSFVQVLVEWEFSVV